MRYTFSRHKSVPLFLREYRMERNSMINKKNKFFYVIMALAAAVGVFASGCSGDVNNDAAAGADNGGSGGRNYWNSTADDGNAAANVTSGTNIKVSYSDFDENVQGDSSVCTIVFDGNSASVTGNGAEVVKGDCTQVKITSGGTYSIAGETENGQIYVEAGENQVHLILNGVSLHCEKSAPIYVNNGKKTVVTLADGKENTLTDGKNYEYYVEEKDETTGEIKGEPNAAFFSKKALTINGTGTLKVMSNFNNGIGCKDELKIINGNIDVTAVNNAIRGNDCVVIKAGAIKAESTSGDGIKSTKEDNAEKGYIYIEGGVVNVTAHEDALQAVTLLAVTGGEVSLSAGDDGMHCDNTLAIGGGKVKITKSYEGIEATVINITGGKTYVKASDDGLNGTVGSNSSSDERFGGGFGGDFGGGGGMQYQSECQVNISGGYLYVDAGGDGLDSNGDLTITGGTAVVNGPTNSGNGALDANGTISANGGFLVAVGSSGMAEYPAGTSTQNVIAITLPQAQQAGTIVRIVDENGADLLTFAPAKSYNSVVFSSPDIKSGSTYTAYVGGEYSGGENVDGLMASGSYAGGTSSGNVKVSQIISTIGSGGGGMGGPGGMGDPGGMGGPGGRPDKKPGKW